MQNRKVTNPWKIMDKSGPTPPLKYRLRHVLPYYRQHRVAFIMGFLMLAASSITAAAIPYLLKLVTEALSVNDEPKNLGGYAITLVLLALVNAVFRIRSRTHIFAIGRKVEYEIRKAYHAKLLSLDMPFFNQEKTGDLVSRGSSDVLAVRMFIGPGFLQISNTFMVYLVTLPVMIGLDPYLTLLALLPFPLILGISRLLTKRLYLRSKAVADRFGKFSAFVQEAVVGAAVIRAHAREEDWQHRFGKESEGIYQAHIRHARLQSIFAPMVVLAGGLGGWIILFVGGQEVMAGRLTVGDFVAFSGYLAILIWPTVGFGWILTVLQRGLAALERIGQILDTEPFKLSEPFAPSKFFAPSKSSALLVPSETAQHSIQKTISPLSGAVVIKNLHYPEDKPILKGIEMEIQPGSFVGLVGRVGSGKSTLLNCLSRLYPVAPGSLFVDGQDIMAIPEERFRHTVALAQQESFLFSSTIRENLCLGKPECDDETAWQTAQLAAFAKEIKSFPDGLDTLVGERGITLSGGQRQRLSLARALLMQPAILLLDDIFSSIDASTEAEILDNIHDLAGTRTIIMVCHRTSALYRAERIFLLEEGEIVTSGHHDELLKMSSLYQNLHQQMARAEALESLQ